MMRYSVQRRYRIFVKAMDFCILLKKWTKILIKMLKNQQQMQLKLFQNMQVAEETGDLIGNRIPDKTKKVSKKLQNKIIQKQLQMNIIKKNPKKDIYL